MLTIPDPPPAEACGACARPLSWLYSARTGKWVAFIRDGDTARVHPCRDPRPDIASWRTTTRPDPDTLAAGVARARAALTRLTEEQT